MKEAGKLLGADAGKFVLVAVTTDPERDTTQACAAYGEAIGMADSWHFATGPLAKVQTVWKNCYIGVEKRRRKPRKRRPPVLPGASRARTRLVSGRSSIPSGAAMTSLMTSPSGSWTSRE
jgi:hypothetical protein